MNLRENPPNNAPRDDISGDVMLNICIRVDYGRKHMIGLPFSDSISEDSLATAIVTAGRNATDWQVRIKNCSSGFPVIAFRDSLEQPSQVICQRY